MGRERERVIIIEREREQERERDREREILAVSNNLTSRPVVDSMSRKRSTSSLINFAAFAFENTAIISLVRTTN